MSEDKYAWTPSSDLTVDEFVKKFKPSVIDTRDAPWLWVRTGDAEDDPEGKEVLYSDALKDGLELVSNLVTKVEAIESDDSIPVRGKKGVKNKKALRDELHDEAAAELKKVSVDSGWTVGKWMFFPRTGAPVDYTWSLIARSVAYGPLKDAGVKVAKVSPADPHAGENGQHVVCVYVNNLYDKEAATKVLVSLLKDHGLEPSAAKTDLYTVIGIDSKHPSKLRSTIWRVSELVEGGAEGAKKLKEQFKAGDDKKWRGEVSVDEAEVVKPSVSFAETEAPKRRASPPSQPAKRQKSAAAAFKGNDIFAASDSEDD